MMTYDKLPASLGTEAEEMGTKDSNLHRRLDLQSQSRAFFLFT